MWEARPFYVALAIELVDDTAVEVTGALIHDGATVRRLGVTTAAASNGAEKYGKQESQAKH